MHFLISLNILVFDSPTNSTSLERRFSVPLPELIGQSCRVSAIILLFNYSLELIMYIQ